MTADNEYHTAIGSYKYGEELAIGVFRLRETEGTVEVPLPDGAYVNEIDGKSITVKDGKMDLCHCPAVVFTKDEPFVQYTE